MALVNFKLFFQFCKVNVVRHFRVEGSAFRVMGYWLLNKMVDIQVMKKSDSAATICD